MGQQSILQPLQPGWAYPVVTLLHYLSQPLPRFLPGVRNNSGIPGSEFSMISPIGLLPQLGLV